MSLEQKTHDQETFRVDCPHCAEGISFVPARLKWRAQKEDFAAAQVSCAACRGAVRLSADGTTDSYSAQTGDSADN